MNETPLNRRTVTVKVSRAELCDLSLACAIMIEQQTNGSGEKWKILRNKLRSQLDYFDKKIEEEKELKEIKKSIG